MWNKMYVVTSIKCKQLLNALNSWLNNHEQITRCKWIALGPFAADSQTQTKPYKDSDDDNTLWLSSSEPLKQYATEWMMHWDLRN